MKLDALVMSTRTLAAVGVLSVNDDETNTSPPSRSEPTYSVFVAIGVPAASSRLMVSS